MYKFANLRSVCGWFTVLGSILALPVGTRAAETIILGTYTSGPTPTFVSSTITLDPNTAGQTVKIYGSGDGVTVPGINLYLTMQDGVPGKATDGPLITNVDVVTGTIFQNTGSSQSGGNMNDKNGDQFFEAHLQVSSTPKDPTLGPGNDLIATVTFSTVGVAPGTYSLAVDGRFNGVFVTDTSDYADSGIGGPLVLGDATIVVTPEPASLALAGLLLPAFFLRRPRRQAV